MLRIGQKYLPVFGVVVGTTAVDNQSDSPPPSAVICVQNSGLSRFPRFQHHYLHCGKAAIAAVVIPAGAAAQAPLRPQATEKTYEFIPVINDVLVAAVPRIVVSPIPTSEEVAVYPAEA